MCSWLFSFSIQLQAKEDRNKVAVADDDSTVGKLSKQSRIPEGQLKFILEAWNQVVECRRILKYSYAYGYYEFQDNGDGSKKSFFEFLQVGVLLSRPLHGSVTALESRLL